MKFNIKMVKHHTFDTYLDRPDISSYSDSIGENVRHTYYKQTTNDLSTKHQEINRLEPRKQYEKSKMEINLQKSLPTTE